MSTAARDLRAVFFFAVSTFVVLGPFKTQVLLHPSRSAERPWLPMAWQMYHGIGVNMCQAAFYRERDGARVPLDHDLVERAVGPTRQSRYTVRRKARANDVLIAPPELEDIARALCASEPDVRAEMRCAPAPPGGRWRVVHDGATNLCQGPSSPAPVFLTPPPQHGGHDAPHTPPVVD